MNLNRLHGLYLRLDSYSRQMKLTEQEITKEQEKQKVEEIMESEWFVDSCHAYASNGEFNFSCEEFKEAVKKTLKGEKFFHRGSKKRGNKNNG